MTWFRRARSSFWFLPALLCAAALVLAQAMVLVDRTVGQIGAPWLDTLLFQVSATGGRDLLGAIGGSMLAVAATSFSITIMVLTTASATYGPRLVRNFMTDRRNQFVLGIFGSTFLYSLTVLRTIRADDTSGGAFVPDISINLAVVLAVVDVAVLVYFIHHIADSIQVSTLSSRVRNELLTATERMRPQEQPDHGLFSPDLPSGPHDVVDARGAGFVQSVDGKGLTRLATEYDAVVEVLVMPGDHLIQQEPVAKVWPKSSASEILDKVRTHIVLGGARTPFQDVRFAVQQLTDMAVRALSPSMNDPVTASNALQEMAPGLVLFCSRPAPPQGLTDEDGRLRLVIPQLNSAELIDYVFDSLRAYGLSHPAVLLASLHLAERIGHGSPSGAALAALQRQLDLLTAAYVATDPPSPDKTRVQNRAREVSTGLVQAAVEA